MVILFALSVLIAIASGLGVTFGVVLAWDWLDRRYGFPRLG